MQIVVLAGGTGGARFLRGVRAAAPRRTITAVVNTGDDVTMHGLRICPDLDTVMYTLGGGIDEERGWGRAGESWTVKEELAAYDADPTWFGLGDRDLATHLIRTRMLDAGYPLSAVTAALASRWQPGVTRAADERPAGRDPRRRHRPGHRPPAGHPLPGVVGAPPRRTRGHPPSSRSAWTTPGPAPGVVEAFADADAVLLAPSNPVVSIGTILGVPGLREALLASPARIAGVSPIVGGAVVRGMADRCLPVLGIEVSAEGVGRHYGARKDGGLLDAWLVRTERPGRRPRRRRPAGAAADELARRRPQRSPAPPWTPRVAEPARRASSIHPVHGLPEFGPGDDLAGAIATAAPWLADGDVVVVTSKVVSKVEGRLVHVPPGADREAARLPRRRGGGGPRRGPPRSAVDRADHAGLGPGRRRDRRLERRPRTCWCSSPRTATPRPAPSATGSASCSASTSASSSATRSAGPGARG